MNIVKKGRIYEVESSSSKGKFYKVDPIKKTCTCPAYLFRYSKVGLLCKHIEAVKDLAGATREEASELLASIKEKGEVDAVQALDRYGEEEVDRLIRSGDIIEKKGKLTLLG